MAVQERRRAALFEALTASIGEEATDTLFDVLPPPGAELATSAQLEAVEQGLGARIGLLEQRVEDGFAAVDLKLDVLKNELIAAFRGELVAAVSGQTRAVIIATATAVFGIGGLAVTLERLI